jgi:hypothetical protein
MPGKLDTAEAMQLDESSEDWVTVRAARVHARASTRKIII